MSDMLGAFPQHTTDPHLFTCTKQNKIATMLRNVQLKHTTTPKNIRYVPEGSFSQPVFVAHHVIFRCSKRSKLLAAHSLYICTTLFHMQCIEKIVHRCSVIPFLRSIVRFNSKRSDSKIDHVYKLVKSEQAINEEIGKIELDSSPNWELLTPYGYRFFLPGSIGPAWHDASTVAQLQFPTHTSFFEKMGKPINAGVFKCIIQNCPMLLRKGVMEMFPGSDLTHSELTIITLTDKSSGKPSADLEKDEVISKCFVLAAQEICNRLQSEGFWADFINPFSGRPYFNCYPHWTLDETEEKFHCLEFQIEEHSHCKVIANKVKNIDFIGNLFTTAPSNLNIFNNVLNCH